MLLLLMLMKMEIKKVYNMELLKKGDKMYLRGSMSISNGSDDVAGGSNNGVIYVNGVRNDFKQEYHFFIRSTLKEKRRKN